MNVIMPGHAWKQYCTRVVPIAQDELQEMCQQQMDAGDYYKRDNYIQLGGVWWVWQKHHEDIEMVTCYGKTDMDLPAAKRWAKRHNDEVILGV